MGLSMPTLRWLIREHKRRPFAGPILTLGRQCVYATDQQVLELLHQENVAAHPIPAAMSRTTNIPGWQNGPQRNNTNDILFFHALTGSPPAALDASDYEGAEYVWDLNLPVPDAWANKFGLIIDSGTLEHVFNTRQVLINIVRLLKPGGRIIHLSPANNWLEHGFYQFSPTFFYDYYGVNGFSDLRAWVVEQPARLMRRGTWKVWQWHTGRPATNVTSPHMLAVFFSGQKESASTAGKIPQQGQYLHNADAGKTGNYQLPGVWNEIYERTPQWIIIVIKRILGLDRTVKPWGLKYRGRY